MTRRPAPPSRSSASESMLDDKDEFSVSRPLSRKQVTDMIRKKESLVEADLRGCDLNGVSFDNQDLSYAKFAEANLTRCSFKGANLEGTSFFGANLKDACLEEANLEEADLDFCWLDGVSLRGAKIRKAIFPTRRLTVEDIRESVRNGKRLRMEPISTDEED